MERAYLFCPKLHNFNEIFNNRNSNKIFYGTLTFSSFGEYKRSRFSRHRKKLKNSNAVGRSLRVFTRNLSKLVESYFT